MPQIRLLLLAALTLGCASGAWGQGASAETPQESPARPEIEKLIAQSGGDVAVAFRSLDGKQELFIQADKEFPAASRTAKIPVMIELYAEAQAGELRLSDLLQVHNGFRSLVDGGNYQLDPKSDPDPDLYKAIGSTMTLGDLLDHMLTRNSDLAADLLIEKLGADRIRQRIHATHADGLQFRRGFEDGSATDDNTSNTMSARAVMQLLWTLAKGDAVNSEASQEMIGIIANSGSPGPASSDLATRIARMTAEVNGVRYEATVVYGARSFVVAIVARGVGSPEKGAALMAEITHALAAATSP